MRNLKRALSLLLSSTMVLGMLVMGSSAASYKDVDASNEHQEAIEVLQAVGIMTGDQNGNFNPDGSITRNEMAVVMAHLLNLDYDYYRGTNPFTDVPEWAAPYVAACAAEGVVAGIGNGQYGGNNKVTAAEASLMIMKALGYFQNAEDFGTDWQVATIRQASYINLFDRINANAESALTRGQVAQLVLNGLKSNMVDFTGDKGIQIGDITVGYHAEYTAKTNAASKYNTIVTGTTTIIGDNGQYYVQLGEELYNGDLKLANGSDEFERPSRVWSYKGTEIGTYAKKELMVASYTTGISGKTLYDLLTNSTIKDSDLAYYVDGVWNDTTITKANMIRSNDDDYGTTGNGVLTEVYLDNNAKELTIVSINTYLAQAGADYSESKEYAPLNVYMTAGSNATDSYNVDVDDLAAVADVKDEAYYLVNISKKDSAKGEIVALQDAEVMSNSTVTKFSASSNGDGTGEVTSLTVDSTKYNAAKKSFYDTTILNQYNNASLTDATYNVYLDQYGYFIGVDLYEGAKKYVFITGYDRPVSNLTIKTADAAAIFLDGSMDVIKVNVNETNKNIDNLNGGVDGALGFKEWTGVNNDGKYNENRWYTYTVNESGVYTLKPAQMVVRNYTDNPTSDVADTIKTSNVSLQSNMGQAFGVAGNATARVYGEDESVYLTVSKDVVDTSNNAAKAITEVTGVYSGVQNVTLDVYDEKAAGDDCSVYAVYDNNYYIIGAIVLGEAQGNKANIAYVLSQAKSEEKIGDTYYWEFDAIVGGQIQTLTAQSKYPSTIDILEGEMKGTINGSPYTGIQDRLVELRYDSEGKYVTKINDVNSGDIYDVQTGGTYNTTAINGEDVYMLTDYIVGNDGTNTLVLQGRTLYVTANQADLGLALAADAKAVVIQPENGKTGVKTEFSSVASAINYLADYNETTAALEYDGTIVAILDSNGAAQWVVFNSTNELKTGTTQPGAKDLTVKNLTYNGTSKQFGVDASYTGTVVGGKSYSIKLYNKDGALITSTTGTTSASWDATKNALHWDLPYVANNPTGTYTVVVEFEGVTASAVLAVQ